jgi:hypothetical protein
MELDARIAPETFSELSVPDVDPDDTFGTRLKGTVREPAGRDPRIEDDTSGEIDAEPVERPLELLPAPGDEAWWGAADDQTLGREDECRRLLDGGAIDLDPSLRDDTLRLLA